MSKIAILGDTCQDLTIELAKRYDIEILFYQVQMDDKHYKDQIDIDSDTFYKKLPEHEVLMTGTPSPADMIEKLDKIKEEGTTDVIMMTGSVKLTSMFALYSTQGPEYKGMKMYVIDTESIGSAAGLLTIYASTLRKEGYSAKDIVEKLEEKKKDLQLYALFRTLSYLVKGGRFNKYKGMIGNLLNIKPLLKVEDGLIVVKDKYRGTSKSLEGLVNVVKEEVRKYTVYWIMIFSGDNKEEVSVLKEKLQEQIEGAELFIETQLTPVLGVHSGPKAIGVATLGISK